MAARSIGSVVLVLGSVTIPTKLYTAHSKRELTFNRLDRKTGARVKQQQVSAADGRVLESKDIVSAYEYTPDKWVTFEPEELAALEVEADHERVRIVAVVPIESVDAMHIVRTTILGPNKGAADAYALLLELLARREHVAIATRGSRTRDELLVIAPHSSGKGLVMHECLYPDEVRRATLLDPEVIPAPQALPLAAELLQLGDALLDELERPSFDAAIGALVDGGAQRVKAAVDRKVAGRQIVVPPPRDHAKPVDLLEQLRASVPLARRGPKKARATPPVSQARSRRRARTA